jgi:hypothetical protein
MASEIQSTCRCKFHSTELIPICALEVRDKGIGGVKGAAVRKHVFSELQTSFPSGNTL